MLPMNIKSPLMNYVFFNKQDPSINTVIISLSFVIFMTTFLVKFLLMKILIMFMNEGGKKTETEIISSQKRASYINMSKLQNTNLIAATLIANSLSYSFITFIILIRNWR